MPKKMNTVMVVDDSEGDQILVEHAIATFDESITTISAYDGLEALELLKSDAAKPDLILLDINMPGMNGHEFLAELAKLDNQQIVVAMLTTSDQEEDKEKCLAYGFVKTFITKPLSADDLHSISEIIT